MTSKKVTERETTPASEISSQVASRVSTMELTPFQRAIAELILVTPAPGKQAARSALAHIDRAWLLRQQDPEMALFRAITAEEESATSIFHALRRRKYAGAHLLKSRDHTHKAAVDAYLDALVLAFARMDGRKLRPTIEIAKVGTKRLVRLRLTVKLESGESKYVYPVPPLHFASHTDGALDDFSTELTELATKHGTTCVLEHIRNLANRRNRLLYSSPRGVPKLVEDPEPFLLATRDRVFRNLTVYLLIDQYRERQSFVEQSLSAFLSMLGRLPASKS